MLVTAICCDCGRPGLERSEEEAQASGWEPEPGNRWRCPDCARARRPG